MFVLKDRAEFLKEKNLVEKREEKKQGKHHYQQIDTSGGKMKYTYTCNTLCVSLPKLI